MQPCELQRVACYTRNINEDKISWKKKLKRLLFVTDVVHLPPIRSEFELNSSIFLIQPEGQVSADSDTSEDGREEKSKQKH